MECMYVFNIVIPISFLFLFFPPLEENSPTQKKITSAFLSANHSRDLIPAGVS